MRMLKKFKKKLEDWQRKNNLRGLELKYSISAHSQPHTWEKGRVDHVVVSFHKPRGYLEDGEEPHGWTMTPPTYLTQALREIRHYCKAINLDETSLPRVYCLHQTTLKVKPDELGIPFYEGTILAEYRYTTKGGLV